MKLRNSYVKTITVIIISCLLSSSYVIISPIGNNLFQSAYGLEEEMNNISNDNGNSFNINSNNDNFDSTLPSDSTKDKKESSDSVFSSLKDKVDSDVFSASDASSSASSSSSSSSVSLSASAQVTGDFNGDGRDDLAIGVPNEALDSSTTGQILPNAGAVNVIYGSSSGLSATTPIKNQIWTQNSGNVADSSEVDDQFGRTLAVGDFNGDGSDDLAIGVVFEDRISAGDNAGAFHVIYGSSSGLSATTVPDQFWTQNSANVEDSTENGDQFGRGLAAGDFNGDGNDDLAIGASGEDVVSAGDNAGAVNVIYGSSSGLSATTVPDQFWTQNSGSVEDSSESGDSFGNALAGGDFNGDGNDDLAIGVLFEDVVSEGDEAGAVNVIYGSSSGLSATTVPDQFWTQNSDSVEDSSESGDSFGNALAGGDFNGDGNDDLAIGVVSEDVVSVGDNAGAVNVIYGSLSRLSATTVPDQFWTQNSGSVEDSSESGDSFGSALAAGDFNGDGNDDLAIGVVFEDNNAGAVNVIYGTLSGLSEDGELPDKYLTQSYANVEDTSEVGDLFGSALAAGDFNGGNDDLAIGVSGEDLGSPSILNAGAVHVIYGGSVGLSPTQTSVFDQFFSQSSPDIGLAPDSSDDFGSSLG